MRGRTEWAKMLDTRQWRQHLTKVCRGLAAKAPEDDDRVGSTFRRVGSGPRKVIRGQLCGILQKSRDALYLAVILVVVLEKFVPYMFRFLAMCICDIHVTLSWAVGISLMVQKLQRFIFGSK